MNKKNSEEEQLFRFEKYKLKEGLEHIIEWCEKTPFF